MVPRLSTICFWTKRARQRRARKRRSIVAPVPVMPKSPTTEILATDHPAATLENNEEALSSGALPVAAAQNTTAVAMVVDTSRDKTSTSGIASMEEGGLGVDASEGRGSVGSRERDDDDDDERSESESEDDEDEEDEGPEILRQGQVLWIRGLSRLQTQVS